MSSEQVIQKIIKDFRNNFSKSSYSYEHVYDTHYLRVELHSESSEDQLLEFILNAYEEFDSYGFDELLVITNEELMTKPSNVSSFRWTRQPIDVNMKQETAVSRTGEEEMDYLNLAA